jgi:hypothetical protein
MLYLHVCMHLCVQLMMLDECRHRVNYARVWGQKGRKCVQEQTVAQETDKKGLYDA